MDCPRHRGCALYSHWHVLQPQRVDDSGNGNGALGVALLRFHTRGYLTPCALEDEGLKRLTDTRCQFTLLEFLG